MGANIDCDLSITETILGEDEMEFAFILRYQGPLPTCSRTESRGKEKEVIRKYLSPQLRDLWEHHRGLKTNLLSAMETPKTIKGSVLNDVSGGRSTGYGHLPIRGWKFIPLVVRARGWVCDLKILFLRRQAPGDLIQGGDIDNRIKTLFDGLRIPHDASSVTRDRAENQDEHCFCLLEDDALITSYSIESERLWGPVGDEANESDVELSIRVQIKKHTASLDFI